MSRPAGTDGDAGLVRGGYRGIGYYVTKNKVGAWLAYVDLTGIDGLDVDDLDGLRDDVDRILPFHGGCTFLARTGEIRESRLEGERLLAGCDWCHGSRMYWRAVQQGRTPTYQELCGVEDVGLSEVEANLREVIDAVPRLRLERALSGAAFFSVAR